MTDFRELTNRILIPLEKFYSGLENFKEIPVKNKIRVVVRHKILFIRLKRVEPLSEQMLDY